MKSFYKLDSEKRKNEDLMKKLLAEATIKSEENERKRIGENLHDEIAPILLLASRKLESYKYLHVNNNLDDINSALEYIDSGITRIRISLENYIHQLLKVLVYFLHYRTLELAWRAPKYVK